MTQFFFLIALLAYATASLRILTYRKDGARHRRRVSWMAWLLLVVLMGSLVDLTVGGHPIGAFEALRAVLLTLFVFCARGNVARLLGSE